MSAARAKTVGRSSEPMDEAEAQRTWKSLRDAIKQIYNHNASQLSFEELYRYAYSLVLHKYGQLLYDGVRGAVTEHLESVAAKLTGVTDDQLLNELQSQWDEHKTSMNMIKDILMYMDRNYVKNSKQVHVYDMIMSTFYLSVIRNPKIGERLLMIMLGNINLERTGQTIDRTIMRNTVTMLVELGVLNRPVYAEFFEEPFISSTGQFYKRESEDMFNHSTVAEFLKKAEQRLSQERERVHNYLSTTTQEKLLGVLDREWISAHFKALIHHDTTGCKLMFQDDKHNDMKRMYVLFSRVDGCLEEVQSVMRLCITESGEDVLKDPEKQKDPVLFIESLLALKNKYYSFLKESFDESKEFQHCLKTSFEGFINKDIRTAQFLSLYVDDFLRKGLKGMSETDIDHRLEQVIAIFRFLMDKDVFESFYKQHLAKRLLKQSSLSDEAEKSFIAKLKSECGHTYTSKLEGMFKDMRTSEEIMGKYKTHVSRRSCSLELRVQVLTTGFWPNQTPTPCELPREIKEEVKLFEEFYLNQFSGRRLTWQLHQGTAEVKGNFSGRRYELSCSTYQMVILMLFNQYPSMTYKEILSYTAIPVEELKRQLMSLYVNAKCKILKRTLVVAGAKELAEADVLEVNPEFESKTIRIKIPTITAGSKGLDAEAQATVGDVPTSVEEDRKHLVEASIVRIMKTRKTLDHTTLVLECTRNLNSRFTPSPLLIKQRIEKLIEREYLERSKQDRKVYNYLA